MSTLVEMHSLTRADLVSLLRLATPIVVVQVGIMLMSVVDTVMVGRLSAAALAAVAVANIYFFGIVMFGFGVLLALDPIVAQALGAGDELAVKRGLQRGLVLAVVVALPVSILLLAVEPVLEIVRQPAEVIPQAVGYVYRVIPSVLPLYGFVVVRQTLQAHRVVAPIVWTTAISNVVNAVLNYAWIYGTLGFPALGVFGSAQATSVSRLFMALLLVVMGWPHLRAYLRSFAPDLLAIRPLARMLRIGTPIGGQMVLEIGAFSTVALLMGWLGVIQVAAHQVAINVASLTFMVPLGVSSAAAVIVGHAVGSGDPAAVRRAMAAALLVGAGFMSAAAVVLIGAPYWLAGIYTTDPIVLALAATLLPIAGVFQVFDGLQVVSIGLLRGLGDTRVPMIVNVVGFWCLGIPVSLWLGFRRDYGAPGLWWGLVLGLTVVALILLGRLRIHAGRDLSRLVIDESGPANQPHTP